MTSNRKNANKDVMLMKTIMNASNESKDKTSTVLIISAIAIVSILVLYFIIAFFAKLPPFSSPSSSSEPIPIPTPVPTPEPTPEPTPVPTPEPTTQEEREETTYIQMMGDEGIFGGSMGLGIGGSIH